MTRDRMEPVPDAPGHGPCEDCANTYRRTMIAGAVVMSVISALGMVAVALIAKALG